MQFLVNHGWALGALVIGASMLIARVRMRDLIAEGKMTEAQANRFCLRAAVVVAVVGVLGEVAALGSGVPMMCQLSLPLTDPRLLPFHVLTVSSGAAFFYWIWRRGGDRTLALVAPAFGRGWGARKIYTPRQIRVWATAVIAVSWTGFVVMRLSASVPPPFPGCTDILRVSRAQPVQPGDFDGRRSWALSYFQRHPDADPLQMIGDYNATDLGKRLGAFSLDEARTIANEVGRSAAK